MQTHKHDRHFFFRIINTPALDRLLGLAPFRFDDKSRKAISTFPTRQRVPVHPVHGDVLRMTGGFCLCTKTHNVYELFAIGLVVHSCVTIDAAKRSRFRNCGSFVCFCFFFGYETFGDMFIVCGLCNVRCELRSFVD